MKSSVLGVGTELTDGQIVNRNASWISAKCKPLGLRSALHLTVPDDRVLILESLQLCASRSDIIFVTGGLGPTSDDFTRDLISEWSGKKLVFDEPSWQSVSEKLKSRGYEVHDFQKQQCFFPEGAVILVNSQGTANGFRLHAHGKDIIALPGPPREIEAIWTDHLAPWLETRVDLLSPVETKSWDLIGLGESQVAAIAEPLVAETDIEVGYRVHLPYVEFKISYPKKSAALFDGLVQKLEAAFQPWTVARDQEDIAHSLAEKLQKVSAIEVIDEVSGAFLLQRLGALLARNEGSRSFQSVRPRQEIPEGLRLWIYREDEMKARIGWQVGVKVQEEVFEAPMKSELLAERRKQFFAERAIAFWMQSDILT